MINRLNSRPIPNNKEEIRAFLVIRNEALRLPSTLRHHRSLGVHRFFVRLCFSCSKASASIELDAIKIDVEGCEDRILVPLSARRLLWPRLLIIEDAGDAWSMDLFSFLATTGYRIAARSKQNVMLHLESAHP